MIFKTIFISCVLLHVNAAISNQRNSYRVGKGSRPDKLLFHSEVNGQEVPGVVNSDQREPSEWQDEPFSCMLGTPCGEERICCCHGNTASCAGQGLRKIPLLPTTITKLDFSNNSVGYIDRYMLQNVTSLVALSLEMNHIDSIHPEAFTAMKHLRVLQVGTNNLTDFSYLMSVLKYAVQLEKLNASDNHFWNMSLSALMFVPTLQTLLLGKNNISIIAKGDLSHESHLQTLDLSSNLLAFFPDFCLNETQKASFLPHLHTLFVEWNIITIMPPDSAKCLPRLKKLNLGGNAIRHIQKNFLQGFPRLENLTLQFCMSKNIDSHAFNHSNLKHLDVSENLWFFDSHYGSGINPGLFRYMPHLQFINMSWTVFRFSERHERHMVLSSLKHVKQFVLQGTGLHFIPQTILRKFTDLNVLSFSKNEISFLSDNTFENLTSLTSLDLRDNHLTSFSQQLLQDILDRRNANLHLSDNPFSCTCDLLWFIERYKEDLRRKEGQRLFTGDNYICHSPDSKQGIGLADVDITRQKCMLNSATYIAILFVISFTLVLLIVGATVYKFRWQLRFMLYTLQHRLSKDSGAQRQGPDPVYDIFVAYDSDDRDWVLGTLQPEMEGRRGLKLCLHERDFTPGMFITHNIIERMDESGAIVPLLSNAFLASDWCRFELFMAIKNGLQRPASATQCRITVVPVLLEELQREGVDSLLCALLNTTTYLAWPAHGGQEERQRFWDTLCCVLDRGRRGGELRMLS